MIIQTIVQIGVIGMAAFAGFGIGWIYRNETWTPRPHRAGMDIELDPDSKMPIFRRDGVNSWDDFQERKRGEKVDIFDVIEWEQEIKDTRVN